VLAGIADADATFAIAALSGLLGEPAGDKGAVADGLPALVATIAMMDTDPIGHDLSAMPYGDILLCWNHLFGGGRDRLAALAGVHGWRLLTASPRSRIAPFFAAAVEADAQRRARGRADLEARGQWVGRVLVLIGTKAPAFDVWYGRRPESGLPTEPVGWSAPVVVVLSAQGTVTVGCPNGAVAAALFGPGGLSTAYPRLSPPGWGGREAIGGGPRGVIFDADEALAAAAQLDALIRPLAPGDTPPPID
jgi:hypothetical protein